MTFFIDFTMKQKKLQGDTLRLAQGERKVNFENKGWIPDQVGNDGENVTPLLPDDYLHTHPISFVSFFDTAYDVFLPLF
jgi:hypothetical protein